MRRALHIVFSILLWIVFIYYWNLVTGQGMGPGTRLAIRVMTVAVVAGTIGTLWWIVHNIRVGRGNRRRTARATPAETLRTDTLGRELTGPELAHLKRAGAVTISIEGKCKIYAIGDEPPGSGG